METTIVGEKKTFMEKFSNSKGWHIALLVLFPVLIYIQSLGFEYTNFDDNGIILQKFEVVGNIKKIDTAFKVDAFFNKTGDFYRPIQNASFMLDAAVSREKLWMFHITNLLIHILTCISLYFFLQLLKLKRMTAFLVSLLFAVHPLFASGVGWIPSRGDILIGLFGIQLFMTFALYFKTKKIIYFLLHTLLFFLTLFTKETTVLFPLFLVYYYFLVFRKEQAVEGEPALKILPLLRNSFLKLLPFFLVWAGLLVFYLMLRKPVVTGTGATIDVLGVIPFFKNNPVIPIIIGKFFVPVNLSTLPLYDNLSTIIGVIFLLAIAYVTVEFSRKKKWAVLMGLLWFLLFAIPPTIYRLENADTFFNYLEHRTYLPMIGILIILGFLLDRYLLTHNFRVLKYVYPIFILIFSVLAFIHCADYRNNFTLSSRAAKLDNPSGLSMRAGNYMSKGDTASALADIEKAIQLSPKDANMFLSRGKIRARMQNHEGAEQDFTLAITLNSGLNEAFLQRSIERRLLKKYEGSFRDIKTVLDREPANPKLHMSLGNLLVEVKDFENAVLAYSEAIKLQPAYAEAYSNRGYAKLFVKDFQGAADDCSKAIGMMGKSPSPYSFNNLGHAYRELNQLDSAFKYFDKAIAAKARFPEAFFERGKAKQQMNKQDDACADWNMALQQGYSDTARTIEHYCQKNLLQKDGHENK
jgi:tetratricopeptide (TPR) repeat protein